MGNNIMKTIMMVLYLMFSLSVSALSAPCPSAADKNDGFLLRHETKKSEFRSIGRIVRVDMDFNGAGSQKQFLYRGLIGLASLGDDGNNSQYFLSDLESFWPLKVGARRSFEFLLLDGGETDNKWSLDLTVTKQRAFPMRFCNYLVLYVSFDIRKNGKSDEKWTAVYSPDLQVTLATIYDEGTEDETMVAYDVIEPLGTGRATSVERPEE